MGRGKKYVSIANRSLQNTIAYRTSYVITLASNFIYIVSIFYLWKAIYSGREQLAGFTWEQMKAYLVITFLANSLLSWYSETRIAGKILDGSVAMDLLKPLDFQKARLAETLGSCILEGLVGSILISAILVLSVGVMLPAEALTWLLFIISLAASVFVKFGIVYLAGLLCFWTTSALGIIWARIALTNLLSGALVPLVFFPKWLESLSMVLPFQSIIHTPTSIYLGHVTTAEAVEMVGIQLFWIVVLWVAGKLMWSWAVRQVTIHGG